MLAERGIDVSYETVRRWALKFGTIIARKLKRGRPRPDGRWYLDEVFVSINGKQLYVWRAVEFLKIARRNLEAINHATANIPPEAMRIHICWGNYSGPHTHDFPVSKLVLRHARAQAILFEGANPRHEHEWEDWQQANIPEDKVLIPGVIDSTTKFRRAPTPRRATHQAIHRHRRARTCDRRNGLRLRYLRASTASGLSDCRLVKAKGAFRRCTHRIGRVVGSMKLAPARRT